MTVLTFKFSVAYKYVITRIGFSYKFSTHVPPVLRTGGAVPMIISHRYRYIKNAISRTVRTPVEGRNDDIFEIEENLNKKQDILPSYANYIPYDHFKVISSEVKECPKCCGNGVINIGM